MKVSVAHPGKQHVFELIKGLSKDGDFYKFYTSLTFGRNHLVSKVPKLKSRINPILNDNQIKRFYLLQLANTLLKLPLEVARFYQYTWFDKWVARQIKRDRPDAIIGYENSCLETFRTAKKNGIITILDLGSVHDDQNLHLYDSFASYSQIIKNKNRFYKNHELKLAEYAASDYIFVLSSYAKDTCVKAGIDAAKIKVLNLGINASKFLPKAAYTNANELNLVFVGRLTELKGIRLIFEALKQINNPNIKLTMVGPVVDKDFINSVDYPYTYKGHLSQDELISCYQSADVFISPSYTDSWAQTVIESMACGTPVIISDNTGAKDAVIQGGGYVIPTGSADALAERILFYYNNRSEIESDGRKAADIAVKYTWDNYHAQLIDAVHEISQKGKR